MSRETRDEREWRAGLDAQEAARRIWRKQVIESDPLLRYWRDRKAFPPVIPTRPGLARGLVIAIPIGLAMWAALIWLIVR